MSFATTSACQKLIINDSKSDLLEKLSSTFSTQRLNRMINVVDNRTKSIAVVLDGIKDVGNKLAIYRTMDALGYQIAHLIPCRYSKQNNSGRTDAGSMKWINIRSWNSMQGCIDYLKTDGYTILATGPSSCTKRIDDHDFSKKTAIVLGSERTGVSSQLLPLVDSVFHVPMVGFVESFNVSVAAAIILYHIYYQRLNKLGYHGDLTPKEKDELLLQYMIQDRRI